MPTLKTYEIHCLPDINMPRYIPEYGGSGKSFETLSTLVYDYLYMMTSFFAPGEITITLRYRINPGASDNLDRLKIFLITRIEKEGIEESDYRMQMGRTVLAPLQDYPFLKRLKKAVD